MSDARQATLTGDVETCVVNQRETPSDVDIGRDDGGEAHLNSREAGEDGWLGNPHPEAECGGRCTQCDTYHTREECIERFRADFEERLDADDEFRAAVRDLHGAVLGCHCAPKPCHGDVIAEWADRLADAEGGSDDE